MVIKRNVILFVIIILCISCERNYVVEFDYDLKRANLSTKIFCNVIDNSLFSDIHLDSITENDFNNFKGKNELNTKFIQFIEPKVLYYLYNDSSKIDYDSLTYYACGKINIRNGVNTYLVLRDFRGDLGFIFLNIKNENLVSIVIASQPGVFLVNYKSETYINNNYKSLFLVQRSSGGIDCPATADEKQDIWSWLGILKPKELKYSYSCYTIDKNGYVKAIPFNKDDFPNYMNY